jgi:diamine N-acetyltransferase
VHLEDLFVQPDYRGQGLGFALLERVVHIAADRGAERVEWMVLNWNTLALDFYHRLGAEPLDDWTTMRLSGEALRRLAGR